MEREARGVVALVVGASRVLGMAPLRVRDAGRGAGERAHAFYGTALVGVLDMIIIIGIILDAVQNAEQSDPIFWRKKYYNSIGWILAMANTLVIVNVGACSGRGRVRRMLEHIEKFEKVKSQADTLKQDNPWWKRKLIILTVFVWTLPFVHNLFTFIYEIKIILVNNEQLFAPIYSFAAFFVIYLIRVVLQLQVLILLFSIHATMEWVTEELSRIYEDIPETRLLSEKEEARLRHVGRVYGYIGDVVNRVNKEDGWLLLLMFVCCYIFTIYGMYWVLVGIFEENIRNGIVSTMMAVFWNLMNIMLIVTFVEPCHQFHNEVEKARVILCRLMYRTQAAGEPSAMAVDVLCKQLLLDAPAFAPLAVCTITRSLCTTVMSAATTILVYIVQNQVGDPENNK